MANDLRQPASPPRVDALVCRLAGGLALMAGAIMLLVTVAISRLPLVAGPDGVAAYAIPGTRHAIEPGAVPLLASIGLAAAALGLVAVRVGRLPRQVGRLAASPARRPDRRRWPKRQPVMLVLGVAALAAALWFKR